MAAGSFGCVVSSEAGDNSLSHCKNYWSNEWVNLIETVALTSSAVSSVETFSYIVKIVFPTVFYLFLSSRISQNPPQDRDINSPLSTFFRNFPHLLFLASNYGNLLIPRFFLVIGEILFQFTLKQRFVSFSNLVLQLCLYFHRGVIGVFTRTYFCLDLLGQLVVYKETPLYDVCIVFCFQLVIVKVGRE